MLCRKICEACGAEFHVRPYRKDTAKYCSQKCSRATTCAALGRAWKGRQRPEALGNKRRAGLKPAKPFAIGHVPWNLGRSVPRSSPATEFKKGNRPKNYKPVGSEVIRNDHGMPRCSVKVGEHKWRLRAVLVWESANGHLPRGKIVHHKNRDSLDDRLENLQAMTRAEHLEEHRGEHAERAFHSGDAHWTRRRPELLLRGNRWREARGLPVEAQDAAAGQVAMFAAKESA